MVLPALVKLGGSVLTDKAKERCLRKAQARRLLSEVARSQVPTVLFHGAGSYGHPPAQRAGLGRRTLPSYQQVAPTLAGACLLHAEVVALAIDAGLHAISVPLHLQARSEGDQIVELPIDAIRDILQEGCTPVLSGTVLRDGNGWRVASADELMVAVAQDIDARLGLFVTDVDGVFDRDPEGGVASGARGPALLPKVDPRTTFATSGSRAGDVTGRMEGKVARALCLAETCPVLIVNGTVRGRVHDVLRGKAVPGTRVTT